jgi:hypothetical protein
MVHHGDNNASIKVGEMMFMVGDINSGSIIIDQ